MKPSSAIQIKTQTIKSDLKKGVNFAQLMKEVEKVAKEPKAEEPVVVHNKAQDFTKTDFTNDQFGELLNLIKPKIDPKLKPQKDKTTKEKRVPKSAKLTAKIQPEKTQPKKFEKPEKLKQEIIVEPRTIEELIRNPHMSSDDENYWGDALDAYPTVKNPFHENKEPETEKTAPKPDFAAFDNRTRDYLDKKQKKLEKLKQESVPSFKPTINKKSEILDKKRNKLDDKTTRFDNLYDVEYINKQQEKNLKKDNGIVSHRDLKEEDREHCTFRPQINKYERSLLDDKIDISERQKVWTQNKQEKIRELQEFQQIKEVTECTFKPEVNKSDLPVMSRLYYK